MAIYVNRDRITGDQESELFKVDPYLHAKWDRKKKVYHFYYMHKHLLSSRNFNTREIEKILYRGGWKSFKGQAKDVREKMTRDAQYLTYA